MKVGVIGAGRLGICFALLLENAGYEVVASDIREDYVKSLQERKIDTHEPGVQELLSKATNITFKTGNLDVIRECDILYTLVATPSLHPAYYLQHPPPFVRVPLLLPVQVEVRVERREQVQVRV